MRALQVDGGSEFSAVFEQTSRDRGIELFVLPSRSPKLNGWVERANRTHTEEFYEITPFSLPLTELNRRTPPVGTDRQPRLPSPGSQLPHAPSVPRPILTQKKGNPVSLIYWTSSALGVPAEFVIYSLRHGYGTRLGEAGADAFSIMKVMGHSSVTVSHRYVHPTPEALERAVERLQAMNAAKSLPGSPKPALTATIPATVKNGRDGGSGASALESSTGV